MRCILWSVVPRALSPLFQQRAHTILLRRILRSHLGGHDHALKTESRRRLIEALVRHDAIGYHQLRETLEQGIAAITEEEGAESATLEPLSRQITLLDAAHKPIEPGSESGGRDWRMLLRDQLRQ